MSIMDIFKTQESFSKSSSSTNKEPSKGETPSNKDNPGTKEGGNPNDPKQHTENPLDIYQKMFDNAAKQSDIQAPNFSIPAEVLAEVAGKMDFTKGISAELMQKATNGDAQAMLQLIQEVGRNSYRASLEHTTKLTEAHLGQRAEFESKRVQKDVKQQLTSQALASNTNYNHPVIKAELNRIANNLAKSPEYVDASPMEIAEAAKRYLDDIHAAMNPKDPKKDSNGKPKDEGVDYIAYLGLDSKS